jgi:glucokinase
MQMTTNDRTGPPSRSEGRPTGPFWVGIDLGGTSIKCGVVDDAGRPCLTQTVDVATEADRGVAVSIQNMADAARSAVERSGLAWDAIAGVGLGSPGTMDIPAGMLLDPVNLRGPGWKDCPIRDRLAAVLGKPVAFQNDANAAAYGEYWAGVGRSSRAAGRTVHSLVLFTLGTGIGCGIIIGDMILEGRHSHGAECGHMVIRMRLDEADAPRVCGCGRAGCLEAYASATALLKRAEQGLDAAAATSLRSHWTATPPGKRAQLIDDLNKQGDGFCRTLMRDTAYYLAVGATNLMHTIDPDMVVFGGGMSASGPEFLDWIRQDIVALAFPTPAAGTEVVYAELGSNAGYIGAAGCARQKFRT